MEEQAKKHRERHSGRKAEKKKKKNPHVQELTDKQRNPKAFTFNSAVKAERRFRRTQDVQTKKQHIPLVDRTPVEPPPVIVAIVGPPKVGKTTLIQGLIKVFTKQPLTSIKGPVTLVSGKKRRLTIIECNNDINSMIDIAKVADLVLLLVDASFGFEMEIFEFLNICQVHGMPRVMGVLTHLDAIKNAKQLKRTKKTLKHRFWTEVYAGAKLFYLSGLLHDEYLRNEVKNLSRFISVMKFRPLTWRTTHPYILADRLEDLTPPELVRQNPKADRMVSLYGYVRGIPLNKMSTLHIPGCGDHKIHDVSHLPDPCPLPDKLKKRSLVEKEKLIYAPFSGVGGIVYDKDAVYVELGGSHSHTKESNDTRPEKILLSSLIDTQETLDMKMAHSELQLFTGTTPITATDFSKDSNENGNPSSEEEAESNDERGDNEGSIDKKRRKVFGSDAPPWERNEALPKKRKHSAIAEAEERLLKVLGDEDDHENEESEIEEMVEESEEDEEMVEKFEKEESVPRKKKKIEINDDEDENSTKQRYRDIASEKDREIHSKISKMLTKLTNERPKKKHLESEDAMESANEDEESLQVKKNKKNKFSAASKQTRRKIKESDDSSESGIEEDENESEKYDDENHYESSDDSDEDGGDDENEDFDEDDKDSSDEDDNKDSSNEDDEDNEMSSESDAEESAVRWKSNLAQKAADAFLERQATTQNLWKLVYGKFNQKVMEEEDKEEQADQGDPGDEIGGLFKVVSKKQANQQEEKDLKDAEDCSIFPVSHIRDWTKPEVQDLIRDCFVTGKWGESEDAEELLRLDEESDGDLYGDFEDLETGEKHKAEEGEKKPKEKELSREKLMEKKRKLKEKFDAEYDEADGGKSYYDELKQEVDHQAQLNKNEFEGMDEEVRIQLEGYRPGLYVRVEISDVPCELITNFDPTYPLILGGLMTGEENIGYVQVRIKKHRWHKKILKTRDPLIMSLGWRRFQTLPIFSKLEDNLKNRMLKYTPEHVTCMANFWGPITPQGTGILAIQNVADKQPDFRIAATGAVVELDKSTQIMKKLKLTGTPYKIYKKTAFIKGMFNSALEVAKFEGAKVKTVSGIRGQIKKAVSKPEGCFRATFEDKIVLSDIVFCRTWYKVEVPKLYNPVTTLLLPLEQKNSWRGMKTVGQLKRERGIRSQVTSDSLYLPIERQPKVFRPLVIPRALQKELPYKDKPKKMPKNKAPSIESQRIAVVREPHEQKVASLMKMLKVSYSHKQEQLKKATKERIAQHRKEVEQEELKKLKRQKELRRQVFRTLSKLQQKSNKR